MIEYVLRFIAGGVAVSVFAVIGDTLRPKTFAGLFGAAPSIAVATLLITVSTHGRDYAATEGRSMIIGAVGLCVYSVVVCQAMKRYHLSALPATLLASVAWFGCALGLNWALSG